MDKNELELLAQKYLDGNATPEEKQLLDQWYDTVHSGLTETVNLHTPETEADVKQRMFNNLSGQLFNQQTQTNYKNTSDALIKRLAIWVGSAAAVVALVMFAYSWYCNGTVVIPVGNEKQLVKAPTNRVMHLTLPDGSKVWLNAGTVFRFPKTFAGKTRVVELVEGRAFFDIKHQTEHPFIVKTKSLNITVLGTSFDVCSYKNEGTTRVSVITGKVGVTRPNNTGMKAIMLVAKQRLVICNETDCVQKEPATETVATEWYKNNFVFDQESLSNVFKALEKEYNTKITVDNKKLLEEKITININNQHLDSILKILSFSKNFKYQMANDSTVIIK